MKIRSPMLTKIVGWLAAWPLYLLSRTLRTQFHFERKNTSPIDPDGTENFLYCVWHDMIMPPILIRTAIRRITRGNRTVALVSQHQDGGYLAETMRWFHLGSVRGSASKGGTRAVKKLLDQAHEAHIVITPDGPRGPRRELKDGILYLASRSGRGIIPSGFAMSNYWRIQGSWTDLILPKPFARTVLVAGKPIYIPEDAARADLETYREHLRQEMDRVHKVAEDLLAGGKVENEEPLRRGDSRRAA